MDNLLFLGMDIPDTVRSEMLRKEKIVTRNMTPEELMAYQLGVDSTISYLKSLTLGTSFLVHIDKLDAHELTVSELTDINIQNMLSYTE